MHTSNPVIRNSPGLSRTPQYSTDPTVSLHKVLGKTLTQFAIIVPVALIAAFLTPPVLLPVVAIGSMLAALALALVISFKRVISVPLILLYSVLEGGFVGGLTMMYANQFDGVVVTAVSATLVTAGLIFVGERSGLLRTSARSRKIFAYALIGYVGFSLIALVATLMGASFMHFGSPIALAVSVFGVCMASFSLLTDVEDIRAAVSQNIDDKTAWRLGFGLTVSLVWLYIEMLRLLGNLSSLARN